jgi:hypothetical protein
MPTENTTFIAVHVPKCAGSSVERHMLENLPATAVWMPRKRYRSMPAIKPPFFEPRREGTDDVRFVSGHHIGKSVEGYFPDHRILRSVLLREPMSFHLSYYNFRSMRYLGQGLNTYSFDDHLLSQRDDPISHFLLERWLEIPRAKLLSMPAQRKFDIINRAFSDFWFVGDLSHCNELVASMSRELGINSTLISKNTKEDWQQRVTWRMLTREDLTARQIEMVEERTRLDRAIWETWRNAKHNVSSVVPMSLPANAGSGSLLHELQRPYHAIVRRVKRGWN